MYRSYANTFLRILTLLVFLPFGWLSSTASAQAASRSNGFNGNSVEMRAAAQAELPALISITFDDEDESVYDVGYPILQSQGIPATFYFITNYLNSQWVTRLNDLQNHGWEIGSHTLSHPMLNQISQTQLINEISQSKQVLQAAGLNVYGFAYPYGEMGSNNAIPDLVAQYYDYARSANPGYNTPDTDPYRLYVQFHTRSVPVSQVKAWIDTAIAQRKWLVLGMHYVDHPSGEYSISSADLQEIATYIKARIDTGQIQAMTMRNAFGVINSSPPSTAPVISAVGASPAETQAIISWATNEPASSIVEYGLTSAYGSVTPEADTSPWVTSHSVMLANLTACTTYHYRTLSRNAAGDQGAGGDFTFTTTGCTTQYPQITNIVTVPSASQAVITWHTSTPASTLVEYGLSVPYEYAIPETDTSPRVSSHSVTLSYLTACTTYHYRVRSFDEQGGDGSSSDLTFITSGCSVPVISSVSAAPSTTQAVITWTTDIQASSIVDYSETTPYIYSMPEIDTEPRVTSHSVTLSYLTACTTYHYRARSRDVYGGEGVTADLTFTTTGCTAAAPALSNFAANAPSIPEVFTWRIEGSPILLPEPPIL